MSEHREWDPGTWVIMSYTDILTEHNATVRAYRDAMAECERLGKANDEACDRIAELEGDRDNAVKNAMDRLPNAPWKDKTATEAVWLLSLAVAAPSRVPFSDAQIERMGSAALKASFRKNMTWSDIIRAALAAGGLEPCAVPEYKPEDVAFSSRVPALERQVNELTEWLNRTRTKLQSTAAKSARRRAALRQLNSAFAVMHATVNLAHKHARDTVSRGVHGLRVLGEENAALKAEIKSRTDYVAVPERASDEELLDILTDAERDSEAIAAVRARVEAPLLAEVAELRAERDRLQGWYEERIGGDEIADRKRLRKRLNVPAGEWPTHYIFAALDERDTLKARVAELEAGKAGWCERDRGNLLLEMSGLREQLTALRQPVDPDAWKTPLFLDACGDEDGDEFTAIEGSFRIIHTGEFNWEYSASDAARAAQWLASYAAAHGCSVGLGEDRESLVNALIEAKRQRDELACIGAQSRSNAEMQICINRKNRRIDALKACVKKWKAKAAVAPIASAETLEQLAEIACVANGETPTPQARDRYKKPVAAILRAAQAYVDVDRQQQVAQKMKEIWGDDEFVAWLNSRIRYRVALPETPVSTKPIEELPSVDDVWAILVALDDDRVDNDGNNYVELERTDVADLLIALRPWLHEPTGWELDVTAQQIIATSKEAHDRCCETEDGINKSDWEVACAVLDLCRSRIRPEPAAGDDMRTSTERYRGLHIAASYLEKALDNIRPIVTTETENELRMEIKASLEKARALMTVAKDEES